jgi:translation initiation factor 1
LTTVQGLPAVLDLKKILKVVKKEFACNGTIIDDNAGKVIQLQGDQRKELKSFLVNELEINNDDIKVHGF